IAQLNPPQNTIPPIPPETSNVASEKRALGRQSKAQKRAIWPLSKIAAIAFLIAIPLLLGGLVLFGGAPASGGRRSPDGRVPTRDYGSGTALISAFTPMPSVSGNDT